MFQNTNLRLGVKATSADLPFRTDESDRHYIYDDMAESLASGSTLYDRSFDDLCKGVTTGYACDCLVDISDTKSGATAEQALIDHVNYCIRCIETQSDRRVEEFYIGKTHVRKIQRKGITFNHMDRSTWRLDDGINKRYRHHCDNGYGRDGLVVLTVVTREAIPAAVRASLPKFDHEDYSLYLERCLIQHFKRNRGNARLHNKSADAGGRVSSSAAGYPLYFAFKVSSKFVSIQLPG